MSGQTEILRRNSENLRVSLITHIHVNQASELDPPRLALLQLAALRKIDLSR